MCRSGAAGLFSADNLVRRRVRQVHPRVCSRTGPCSSVWSIPTPPSSRHSDPSWSPPTAPRPHTVYFTKTSCRAESSSSPAPNSTTPRPTTRSSRSLLQTAQPRSVSVVRMEVPCCSGLVSLTRAAAELAGLDVPVQESSSAWAANGSRRKKQSGSLPLPRVPAAVSFRRRRPLPIAPRARFTALPISRAGLTMVLACRPGLDDLRYLLAAHRVRRGYAQRMTTLSIDPRTRSGRGGRTLVEDAILPGSPARKGQGSR